MCEEDCGWSDEHISYGRNSNNRRDNKRRNHLVQLRYTVKTDFHGIQLCGLLYVRNTQGDILALIDKAGNKVVEYKYDSWGRGVDVSGSMAGSPGKKNPFRYRGYYYDEETGLYYVSSRYYDPEIGCWVSPEPNMYAGVFDSGSGLMGYNVYAYCANNPVNFSDPTGEFIFAALIIGAAAGAVVGGFIGGTVAYNSAKSSGLEGSDLFWATASGVGKEALVGGVAGGLVGATGGIVAAYGVTSVAGTAMITGTATITAKTTEVTALQAKKSANDGDNGWQIANDCIDSVFGNSRKTIFIALTKASTTGRHYLLNVLIKHKGVHLRFNVLYILLVEKNGYITLRDLFGIIQDVVNKYFCNAFG